VSEINRGFARCRERAHRSLASIVAAVGLQPTRRISSRVVLKRQLGAALASEFTGMGFGAACPAGTTVCDDVRSDNGLWLVFPLAVAVAFLFAWPLSRFMPHRPRIGWPLAIIGTVVFVYFYVTGTLGFLWPLGIFVGFFISVMGIGLARGRLGATEPHTA
jgi:hypothetical protein